MEKTTATIIMTILFLSAIAGLIALQIYLSKRESKWLGLILPAISLLISIWMVLGIVLFSVVSTSKVAILENGEVIEQIENLSEGYGDVALAILPSILIFFLANIPTLVLIFIYYACREKLRRDKQIEKMNIQDLE